MTDILWVLAAIAIGSVAFALFLGIIIGLVIGVEKIYRWIANDCWSPSAKTNKLVNAVEGFITFLVVVGGGGVVLYSLGAAVLGASYGEFGWPPIPEWMR